MCIDDGCDELLCCVCAPVAALLCCKFCKDRKDRNNVHQAPPTAFFEQPSSRGPVEDVYDPRAYHQQQQFYFGGPQPYDMPPNRPMQGNYFPSHQGYAHHDLPSVHGQQRQSRSYK